MEKTHVPALRQNKVVLLNKFEKNHSHKIDVVSFDRGVFGTYSIIHPYFALLHGSSH